MSEATATTPDAHDDHSHKGHVVSLQLLGGIFLALLALTGLTVGVTLFDFGYEMNLVVALVVAFVKAILVALYFMHLRWDTPFNSLVLIAALAFVVLFIIFSLMDAADYQDLINQAAATQAAAE